MNRGPSKELLLTAASRLGFEGLTIPSNRAIRPGAQPVLTKDCARPLTLNPSQQCSTTEVQDSGGHLPTLLLMT